MNEQVGSRVGDYEILQVLGAGGMGKVFKVRNVISDRIEAMKVLLPDLAGQQELADRFLREIKLLASLDHPNIAALRTALSVDNSLVMIMEYVEGVTIAARLGQGRIPVNDALTYIDQTLSALSYAHQHGVIHRDIKPANIMLTPDGVVKVMDFGIARSASDAALTMTGTTIGSLYYMSPEQVQGQTADARSDLYAAGISLYEMVTGKRPFEAGSDYSVMAAQVQAPPRPPVEIMPDLPKVLNEIILISVAKDPAQRFQTAEAFRAALQHVPAVPVAAQPVAPPPSAVPPLAIPPAPSRPVDPVLTTPIPSTGGAMPPVLPVTPVPPPMTAGRSGNRGLYVTLGAALVLVLLIAAGITVPKLLKTHATTGDNQPAATATPSVSTDQNAAAQPMVDSQSTDPGAGVLGTGDAQNEDSKMETFGRPKHNGQDNSGSYPSAADIAAMKAEQQRMVQLEHQADQLESRADVINGSLDNLRRQQEADGLGLRGDIAASQSRMKANLAKAKSSLESGDGESAKRFLEIADAEADQLEKFLGR